MSSLCTFSPTTGQLTLPSRTDIDGIGTRIATYIQLATSVITIALSPDGAFDVWWAILVTSLALQITAFVQAGTDNGTLTLFHAILVTLLSYPVFAMSWVYLLLHWREMSMPIETQVATHVHGFVFLGFGLYVWGNSPVFGLATGCPPNAVNFDLFGANLDPTGPLRIVVLTLYGLWSLLFLLAFLLDFPLFCLPRLIPSLTSHPFILSSQRRLSTLTPQTPLIFNLITAYNLFSLIISIVLFELTIHANLSVLNDGDEQWTLGQISAMIMLVVPFISLGKLVKRTLVGGLWVGSWRWGDGGVSAGAGAGVDVGERQSGLDEVDGEGTVDEKGMTEDMVERRRAIHTKQETDATLLARDNPVNKYGHRKSDSGISGFA